MTGFNSHKVYFYATAWRYESWMQLNMVGKNTSTAPEIINQSLGGAARPGVLQLFSIEAVSLFLHCGNSQEW